MKKNIYNLNFKSKRVFLRCDFNVPLDSEGNINNDLRIINALPTIKKLINDGAKLIIASHLGRPQGQRDAKYSLKPIAVYLSKLLNKNVELAPDSIGEEVENLCGNLKEGEIVLLENVRFHKEETSKDLEEVKEFAKNYIRFVDIFVNDAFGTAHRNQSSVVGLAMNGIKSVAGHLLMKELEYFDKVLGEEKENPVVAILGGAKVSDKILLIENMLKKVDKVLIGGGMAYTFQYAMGRDVGSSLLEKDKASLALSIVEKAKELGVELILPCDSVIADSFSNEAEIKTIPVSEDIAQKWEGVDIGRGSIELFKGALEGARTIIWNGPVGVFEIEAFSKGSEAIANILADSSATVIVGGGDTASAIYKFSCEDRVSHISTGGGSSLELLEGKELPGVQCLENLES